MLTGWALALSLAALSTPNVANSQPAFSSRAARRIDKLAQAEIKAGRTPGLAIAVVAGDRLVYQRGFGYANLVTRSHVTATTPFGIGSITKQFTAAMLLLLQQQGRVGLDDRVTKYVPELKIASGITIRELLQQTSGLPDYTKAPGILANPTHHIALADLIAAVNAMPLESTPGKQFRYNNFNYFIAGLIVERASGKSYAQFLHEAVLQPLGLHSTWYSAGEPLPAGRATGYTGTPKRFRPAAVWDPSWLLGAGGIVSSVYDLAWWDMDLPSLLNQNNLASMFAPGTAGGGQPYALGWVTGERAGTLYAWHNGELGGYHSMNALLPERGIAVVVLANTDELFSNKVTSPEKLAEQILDIVAPAPPVAFDPSVTALASEWLGRLASRNLDRKQLTPSFNAYLTDQVVSRVNVASLGALRSLKPLSSSRLAQGNTQYVFLADFDGGDFQYTLVLAKDGKIDGLLLVP